MNCIYCKKPIKGKAVPIMPGKVPGAEKDKDGKWVCRRGYVIPYAHEKCVKKET